MKSRKLKGIEYFIYDSPEEFRREHTEPIVENWRKGNEGDWVLSDDGCIVQILGRKIFKSVKWKYLPKYYVRTIAGSFPCHDKVKMDTNLLIKRTSYAFGVGSANKPNTLTTYEITFLMHMMRGLTIVEAGRLAFTKQSKDQTIERKGKKILLKASAREFMNKAVENAAGVAKVKLSEVMKRMEKRARTCGDPKTAQKADETLGKWLGADAPDEQKTTTYTFGQEIIGELDNAEVNKLSDGSGKEKIHGGNKDKLLQRESKQESEKSESRES